MPIVDNETGTRNTHPYVYYCDKPWCFYRIAVKSKIHTIALDHTCPRTGDKRIGVDIMASILRKLWEELDDRYDKFTKSTDAEDKKLNGYIMRGMAIAMAPTMVPYFQSADDIVREVVARHEERANGGERNTPGLGTFIPPDKWSLAPDGGYTSDPAQAGAPSTGRPSRTRRAAPQAVPTKRVFEPHEITAIKQAHAAGFDMSMLTTAYDCTAEDIQSVLA